MRYETEEAGAVNNAKYLALLLIFFGVVMGAIYLTAEKIVLQKVVLALVMPAGFLWLALLTLTYFLLVNNRKFFGLLTMILTLVYSLCGNGFVAGALATSLEGEFYDVQIETAAEYDYLVLLGGGTRYAKNEQSQLGGAGDRVMVTAQMYHLGKTEKILCTGSPIKFFAIDGVPSPGEQSREILIRAGVPADDIELIDGRNTSEELRNLAKRFENTDTRVGLVTSAWHMPRAMRLAEKNQLQVEPVPADFIAGIPKFTITSLIPSSGALDANTKLLKELLAKQMGQ